MQREPNRRFYSYQQNGPCGQQHLQQWSDSSFPPAIRQTTVGCKYSLENGNQEFSLIFLLRELVKISEMAMWCSWVTNTNQFLPSLNRKKKSGKESKQLFEELSLFRTQPHLDQCLKGSIPFIGKVYWIKMTLQH